MHLNDAEDDTDDADDDTDDADDEGGHQNKQTQMQRGG